MNLPITVLENEWVKLVPLTESDFETLAAVASDPLIWDQHPDKERYKPEVFRKFFDGALNGKMGFAIHDNKTGEMIGSTRYYEYDPQHRIVAVGYTFFARNYWGGPHNRASKDLMLDYAFTFVDRVHFHVATENIRSRKAVLKLGAKKIGIKNIEIAGSDTSHCDFTIEKKDWLADKQRSFHS